MAADYVKYSAPVATSMSLLAWAAVEFQAGLDTVRRLATHVHNSPSQLAVSYSHPC